MAFCIMVCILMDSLWSSPTHLIGLNSREHIAIMYIYIFMLDAVYMVKSITNLIA